MRYVHSIVVMRAQPFHFGHERLIDQMLDDSHKVTILLGSIQESGTERNPFNYESRRQMLLNVYERTPDFGRIDIIGISDINNNDEWPYHVLRCVAKKLPESDSVDACYVGSPADGRYFEGIIQNIEVICRSDRGFSDISGTSIRAMLRRGEDGWKELVNPVNREIIESSFPIT